MRMKRILAIVLVLMALGVAWGEGLVLYLDESTKDLEYSAGREFVIGGTIEAARGVDPANLSIFVNRMRFSSDEISIRHSGSGSYRFEIRMSAIEGMEIYASDSSANNVSTTLERSFQPQKPFLTLRLSQDSFECSPDEQTEVTGIIGITDASYVDELVLYSPRERFQPQLERIDANHYRFSISMGFSQDSTPIIAALDRLNARSAYCYVSFKEPEIKDCYLMQEIESDLAFRKVERDRIASIRFLSSKKAAPDDAWDVSRDGDGSVLAWITNNGKLYDLTIAADGMIVADEDCHSMFMKYKKLTQIEFNNCFDTSNVSNMSSMFYGCSALTSLDLSSFDTSRVTDMDYMFSGCSALSTLDLSSFDTSNVTKMNGMFMNCNALSSIDLSSFNTSEVTDMSAMFLDCNALTRLDLSSFDTRQVTLMRNMFKECTSLTKLDISGFDTRNVTEMHHIFAECENLKGDNVTAPKFNLGSIVEDDDRNSYFQGCEDGVKGTVM